MHSIYYNMLKDCLVIAISGHQRELSVTSVDPLVTHFISIEVIHKKLDKIKQLRMQISMRAVRQDFYIRSSIYDIQLYLVVYITRQGFIN